MLEALVAEALGLVTAGGEPVPLVGVEVKADLVGCGVRVSLAQRFVNSERQPVEAVYKFPLPEGGAVCGFRVRIGGRLIASEIDEREAALRRYDEALAAGHGAYLLDRERPNVYTVSVGNLEPGAEAVTEVTYVGLLDASGSRVRFFLPTTVSPRYVPEGLSGDARRRAHAEVNPEFALAVPYGLRLALTVHDRAAVESVSSPSHHVAVDVGGDVVRVEFVAETAQLDRDVVVDVDYQQVAEQRGYRATVDGETFAQVDLALPERDAAGEEREVVFVVDCSGSMMGTSITQARQALGILLRSLPQGTRFNVLRFGSTYQPLFPTAEPYSVASADTALGLVEHMDADLGGTQILQPLEAAMAQPPVAATRRAVILLTDGQVFNESDVVRLVEAKRERNRVFTVGIGHGPNEYFVRQVARSSGGLAVMIAPGERLEPPVLRLCGRAMATPVTGLRIAWPGPAEQAPDTPVVHLGETASVFARAAEGWPGAGSAAITARVADEAIDVRVPLQQVAPADGPLPQLWAREAIRDLEEGSDQRARRGSKQDRGTRDVAAQVVALSRRYGVISRHTSFVAIETRQGAQRTSEQSVLRRVPVMLTRDWHGLGMFQPAADQALLAMSAQGLSPDVHGPLPSAPRSAGPTRALFAARAGTPRRTAAAQSRPPQHGPADTAEAKVLDLLALQRPEGGFPLAGVAELADLPRTRLHAVAEQAHTAGQHDADAVIATAVALALLRARFAARTSLWEPLVVKSERWLADTLAATPVTIDGRPLENWARTLVESSPP